MEFWCGTCRYDTQAQCWVQSFIARAAHFDVTVLNTRPTGEGGTPKRLKIWLFQGGKHWWNRLKLSRNNPSPLAHHFHQVSTRIQSQVWSGLLRLLRFLWSVVGILAVPIVLRSTERRPSRALQTRLLSSEVLMKWGREYVYLSSSHPLAPCRAVATMKLCTQHCAQVWYLCVLHQNSTSKCPSVAHKV